MSDVLDPFDIDISKVTLEPPTPEDTADTNEQPKRRTRRTRADKGQPRKSGNAKLAEELLNPWAKIAKTLMWGAPTVAAVMMKRGENTVDAIVSIASGYPRMLQALHKVSKIGPATDLAETALMILIAAAIDFGRMPPDNPMVALSGVGEVYDFLHQDDTPEQQPHPASNGNGFVMSAPPGFTPPPGF